jgi:membrane protease YdiL (CAAX protease family)
VQVTENPPAGPPERPDGTAPAWPLWTPLAVIGLGLAVGLAATAVLVAALEGAGVNVDDDAPGFNAAATLVIDLAFVGATLFVLARIAPLRPWQLGFRRGAPVKSAIGIALIAVFAFFTFAIAYQGIFQPDNPQEIVEDLGADRNTLLLVAGALLVIVVAPVAEELFFRGFVFRVLRLRMSFWFAAAIDGVLFGLVHGALVILPILAFLGAVLCWTYERSGTLFVPIALHALNNALAYGVTTQEAVPAIVVGLATVAGCVAVPALLPRRTPSPLPFSTSSA